MNKNKVIFTSILCICATIAFGLYLNYKSNTVSIQVSNKLIEHKIKDRELEVGIYDQYNYCLNSVIKGSRTNGKPCSLEDAERACAKFNDTSNKSKQIPNGKH